MEKEIRQNWYILFVRGGREKEIIKSILNTLKSRKIEELLNEIKILENVRNGRKMKNLLSGYIFVNCNMKPELLSALYSVPDVISFLNHKKNDLNNMPNHLSTLEVNNFLFLEKNRSKSLTSKKSGRDKISSSLLEKSSLKIGDLVLVKEGFFKGHRALIVKVDNRKHLITINVDFFGRSTPVDVKISECEKI